MVDGERLSNLRFADDLVLLSESVGEMIDMIDELKKHSERVVGLGMNAGKTKIYDQHFKFSRTSATGRCCDRIYIYILAIKLP